MWESYNDVNVLKCKNWVSNCPALNFLRQTKKCRTINHACLLAAHKYEKEAYILRGTINYSRSLNAFKNLVKNIFCSIQLWVNSVEYGDFFELSE